MDMGCTAASIGIEHGNHELREKVLGRKMTDGEILNERVVRVLNAPERMMLVDAQRRGQGGLTSHVVDAVGLGLFTMGRMGKAGVI